MITDYHGLDQDIDDLAFENQCLRQELYYKLEPFTGIRFSMEDYEHYKLEHYLYSGYKIQETYGEWLEWQKRECD